VAVASAEQRVDPRIEAAGVEIYADLRLGRGGVDVLTSWTA